MKTWKELQGGEGFEFNILKSFLVKHRLVKEDEEIGFGRMVDRLREWTWHGGSLNWCEQEMVLYYGGRIEDAIQ